METQAYEHDIPKRKKMYVAPHLSVMNKYFVSLYNSPLSKCIWLSLSTNLSPPIVKVGPSVFPYLYPTHITHFSSIQCPLLLLLFPCIKLKTEFFFCFFFFTSNNALKNLSSLNGSFSPTLLPIPSSNNHDGSKPSLARVQAELSGQLNRV